jgi:predicted metal-dependent hydrolase
LAIGTSELPSRGSTPERWVESTGVITVDGHNLQCDFVRSRRARKGRIRFIRGIKVEVVLPPGVTHEQAEEALQSAIPWFRRQIRETLAARAREREIGDHVLYRGRQVPVCVRRGARTVRMIDGMLVCGVEDEDRVLPALEAWMRAAARRQFLLEIQAAEEALGVHVAQLRVADQRTRWGSCSTRGTVSLNWRLILAPPPVLRYVVIHEVAHLREPNHSKRFWALVEQMCPDYSVHRRWLREHGSSLTLCPSP